MEAIVYLPHSPLLQSRVSLVISKSTTRDINRQTYPSDMAVPAGDFRFYWASQLFSRWWCVTVSSLYGFFKLRLNFWIQTAQSCLSEMKQTRLEFWLVSISFYPWGTSSLMTFFVTLYRIASKVDPRLTCFRSLSLCSLAQYADIIRDWISV